MHRNNVSILSVRFYRNSAWAAIVCFLVSSPWLTNHQLGQDRSTPAAQISIEQASKLADLALRGIDREFPNKPAHVMTVRRRAFSLATFTPRSMAASIGTAVYMVIGCSFET